MQYCTDDKLQNWVRSLWALSLVPAEDVVECWESIVSKEIPIDDTDDLDDGSEEAELVANSRQRIVSFSSYFEATWIGPVATRNGGRKPARFPVTLWNKFEVTLSMEDLNTNRWRHLIRTKPRIHQHLGSPYLIFTEEHIYQFCLYTTLNSPNTNLPKYLFL